MSAQSKSTSARDRILEAADRLFYRDGIRAVGIDTVIAEAGVAKMTLYSHFKSKDDLIAVYLRRRDEQFLTWFANRVEEHASKSGDWIASLFTILGEWFATPDFRGCAFINATAELPDPQHPGRIAIAEHMCWVCLVVVGVLRKARVKNPEHATRGIGLLIDGAILASGCDGSRDAADMAHEAARKLLGRE